MVIAVVMQITVVEHDIVEPHQISCGVDVHFADTLCMITGTGQFPGSVLL